MMFRDGKYDFIKTQIVISLLWLFSTYVILPNQFRYGVLVLPIIIQFINRKTYMSIKSLAVWLLSVMVIVIRGNLQDRTVFYFAFGFFICLIISCLVAPVRKDNLNKVNKLIWIIVSINFIVQIIEAVIPSVIAKAISAIFNNVSYESIINNISEGNINGLLVNTYAVVFFDFIALVFLIFYDERRRFWFHRFGIAIVSVLLSGSRSNIVSIPLVLCIVYIYSQQKGHKFTKAFKIGFSVLLLVMVYFIVSEMFGISIIQFGSITQVASQFFQTGNLNDGRSLLYAKAWELFSTNKLWGIGWFQYRTYSTRLLGLGIGADVHNIYLQLLCEVGIIGTIIFLFPYVLSLKRTINMMQTTIDYDKKSILCVSLSIQLYILISSAIHATFYNMLYISLYFLAIRILHMIKGGYYETNKDTNY